MLVARTEAQYRTYLEWLADYLYRPWQFTGTAMNLQDARAQILAIESEIASEIWSNPGKDYPPNLGVLSPRHADILHREAIAGILSRLPDHCERVSLLHTFYQELARDSSK